MRYELDSNADISNTSWVADFEVAPADVVRAFGPPQPGSDPYKVSGLYTFVNGHRVFTLYDWKATALYSEELPSPLAFWQSRRKECLSIGSNRENAAEVSRFKRWLQDRVRA